MLNSQRKVIGEDEILALACRHCHSEPGVGCKNAQRHALVHHLPDMELAFHSQRIMDAFERQATSRMGRLSPTDKALITYYAFVMLCDSVSTKTMVMFGKEFTSEDIQKFFATEAVKELRKDKLIG